MNHQRTSTRGFSLIELVIVVVIIGIIGAIAIPRMSRGAAGASESALVGNLSVLRNALDLYATEHDGDFPTLDDIADQLTGFTDIQGNVNPDAERATPYIYGPYLRSVPPLPVGSNRGETGFAAAQGTADAGWIYDADTGHIEPNTEDETDGGGELFREY
ncbi:MAG: prepilin-type N-terminal cleavage/methylation domain-containing protein [Phycisphaeraceae bacterium]